MNQLQRARGIVQAIGALEQNLEQLRKQLEQVLDQAQNGPPDGMSDMTIAADSYTSLRQLERQMTYFMGSLAGAKRV